MVVVDIVDRGRGEVSIQYELSIKFRALQRWIDEHRKRFDSELGNSCVGRLFRCCLDPTVELCAEWAGDSVALCAGDPREQSVVNLLKKIPGHGSKRRTEQFLFERITDCLTACAMNLSESHLVAEPRQK